MSGKPDVNIVSVVSDVNIGCTSSLVKAWLEDGWTSCDDKCCNSTVAPLVATIFHFCHMVEYVELEVGFFGVFACERRPESDSVLIATRE